MKKIKKNIITIGLIAAALVYFLIIKPKTSKKETVKTTTTTKTEETTETTNKSADTQKEKVTKTRGTVDILYKETFVTPVVVHPATPTTDSSTSSVNVHTGQAYNQNVPDMPLMMP